ncbi:MAG: hypothetical protein AAGA77_16365, partial [Bacteroidota bacterium]
MKYNLSIVSLIGFLSIISVNTSWAQFDGGNGDGQDKSGTIQQTLNGASVNTLAMYLGGNGDGQDKDATVITLAGNVLSVMYEGGNGDGHDKDAFLGTLIGQELSFLYLGGNGDGQDKVMFAGVLDGAEIASLYGGGNGDGQDKNMFSGVLDGAEIAQLFGGGVGDGHDKDMFAGVLDGAALAGLYSGGVGDGQDKNTFAGVLDGAELAALYSGGNGDGFTKNVLQYIFDFPGCTFVVNTDDNGFGSLRYAINCASPGDTIEFSPLLINDTIALTSTNLEVTQDLFINGNKAAELTVDASLLNRAFKMGANSLTIKGLRIIVGTEASGGAVLSSGMLTLMDVDIYDPTNNATSVIQTSMTGSLRIRGEV